MTLQEVTEWCNTLAQTDIEAYKALKPQLPAITWSGTFSQRKTLIQHSGFIVLDFDNTDIGTLFANLATHPSVFFAFVSPSGKGGKAVIPVDPIPNTTGTQTRFQRRL